MLNIYKRNLCHGVNKFHVIGTKTSFPNRSIIMVTDSSKNTTRYLGCSLAS